MNPCVHLKVCDKVLNIEKVQSTYVHKYIRINGAHILLKVYNILQEIVSTSCTMKIISTENSLKLEKLKVNFISMESV